MKQCSRGQESDELLLLCCKSPNVTGAKAIYLLVTLRMSDNNLVDVLLLWFGQ